MKLYEVNQRIADLTEQLELGYDPETGEVIDPTDDVIMELESLQEKREDILQWIAKLILNTRSDIAALKAEKKRLETRKQSLELKEHRLLNILNRETGGKKTDLGVATFATRATHPVVIDDPAKLFAWAQKSGHLECMRIIDPEPVKPEIKRLIDAKVDVEGAHIEDAISYNLK